MRAAIYCRVSTEEQAQKYGLGSQLSELRAYAKSKRYTIPEGAEFLDDGHSGADIDRPALRRLRDAVRARAFQAILIHDPDRLARRLSHQLILTEEFERAGVEVEFVTVSKDASPEGRLLLQVKGVIAEYEREKIRERTGRGRKEKARRGLVVTGPYPYGYRPDPANPGQLVIHDEEAEVVRTAYRWLVEDHRSLRSIVIELRRLGIRPRRSSQWAASSVRKLLTSPFYIGQAFYNRREKIVNAKTGRQGTGRRFRPENEWIPISVPAIVTPERFKQAETQLGCNRATQAGRPPVRFYLLRGLLRCGACGKKFLGTPSHGRRIYRCFGRDRLRGPQRCRVPTMSAEKIEAFIWETVVGVLRNPEILTEKAEAHQTRLGVREVELRSEAEHLIRQLADLERQEQRLLDLYLADGLVMDSVLERLGEFGRRRAGLEERLAKARTLAVASAAKEARQGAVRRYCTQALRGLEKLEPERRQRLLRALIDEVVLKEGAVEIHGVLPGRWVPPPVRNRAQQQHVVAAGGGDLERALGVGLAPDVGEVEIVAGRRHRLGRDRRRRRRLAVQQCHGVSQRRGRQHAQPVDGRGLAAVVARHEQRADAAASARQADGQRSPHRLDLTVESQLTDDGELTESPVVQRAGGGQDAERDGQVERRALLAQIGGGEVHRDSIGREGEAGIANRRAHALAALAHGRVGQADGGERGQPRGDVDLDAHEGGPDAVKRCRQDVGQHERHCSGAVRPPSMPGFGYAGYLGTNCAGSGRQR